MFHFNLVFVFGWGRVRGKLKIVTLSEHGFREGETPQGETDYVLDFACKGKRINTNIKVLYEWD